MTLSYPRWLEYNTRSVRNIGNVRVVTLLVTQLDTIKSELFLGYRKRFQRPEIANVYIAMADYICLHSSRPEIWFHHGREFMFTLRRRKPPHTKHSNLIFDPFLSDLGWNKRFIMYPSVQLHTDLGRRHATLFDPAYRFTHLPRPRCSKAKDWSCASQLSTC